MKLFSYPTPKENPNCLCDGGMRSMFCQTGHMTECHSGMICRDARCAHLPRYSEDPSEFPDYTVENAPKFIVRAKYNDEVVVEDMAIYAPDATRAIAAMQAWICQTENLSRLALVYEVEEWTDVQEAQLVV